MLLDMTSLRLHFMFALGCFALASCTGLQLPAEQSVQTGIDVLQSQAFEQLRGRKVGLISNHTGVNRNGASTIALLHQAPELELAAIFSPEHGINGILDIASIDNAIDTDTGLEVFSLYGETRQPTAAMLKGIDTLVFDIQDIGTRFYTYISTMGLAMQAAAANGVEFVFLDRPNPINGTSIEGPVLDDGEESFVGFHSIPVRHGMTVGELARLFQAELVPELKLIVVPVRNWQRRDYYDQTGLHWINPSPNMRSLNAAVLYPGIGLLETTNLSVGRGTETPFEVLGAPWLDGQRLADELNRMQFDGIEIQAIEFTPDASKFQHEVCSGIRMTLRDADAAKPLLLGLAIAVHLSTHYPETWDVDAYLRLLGDANTLAIVKGTVPADRIVGSWQSELARFAERRNRALLYP